MLVARSRLKRFFGILLIVLPLLILAYAGTIAAFGSMNRAIAYLRGEHIFVEPPQIDFGTRKAGESHPITMRIVNWSNDPVNLLGTDACCEFRLEKGLPAVISPGQSQELEFVLFPGLPEPAYERIVGIFTDNAAVPVARVTIIGRVTD